MSFRALRFASRLTLPHAGHAQKIEKTWGGDGEWIDNFKLGPSKKSGWGATNFDEQAASLTIVGEGRPFISYHYLAALAARLLPSLYCRHRSPSSIAAAGRSLFLSLSWCAGVERELRDA